MPEVVKMEKELEIAATSEGMSSQNMFDSTRSFSSPVIIPNSLGMLPRKLFSLIFHSYIMLNLPISEGSDKLSEF